LALAQAHTRAAAIFVDEFDAGAFESLPQDSNRCPPRLGYASFYLPNSHDTDASLTREVLLAPIKESARCPALRWCEHRSKMPI
jgi:hypothetical protein